MPQFALSSIRRALLLTVAVFALVAQPSMATPFKDALTAYASGDFNRALQILRPLAEEGDANAQFWLGMMYRLGEGVPPSKLHAYVWFYLAMVNSDAGSEDFHDAMKAVRLTEQAMTSAQIEVAHEQAKKCYNQQYKNCN